MTPYSLRKTSVKFPFWLRRKELENISSVEQERENGNEKFSLFVSGARGFIGFKFSLRAMNATCLRHNDRFETEAKKTCFPMA